MSLMSRIASSVAFFFIAGGTALSQDAQSGEAAASPAAQAQPAAASPARPQDVGSMDAIIVAFYDVLSGDAGVKRNWGRFRSLFYPGARMIPTGANAKTGKLGARIASIEEYIKANQAFLEEEGFHEVELSRHADGFGSVTQVFSAYEARNKTTDATPFLSGINSFQLLNDGTRWWILTVAWSPATPANPLPDKYLKKPDR